jgi:hypothetical protein
MDDFTMRAKALELAMLGRRAGKNDSAEAIVKRAEVFYRFLSGRPAVRAVA